MNNVHMMPKCVKEEFWRQSGCTPPRQPFQRIEAEMRQLQRTTNNLIPKATFKKVARDLTRETKPNVLRIEKRACELLQSASESYLVSLFQDSQQIAAHSKRVTVTNRDLLLALRLRY
ncbi:histone H3, putative [Entamoeba invadens IP1]|uniref:Histone H3, putative n=1 Tax=Entamoeba invadens IP1 TaxID=370355 RepID=A0A0A1U1H7_ENTIV|nr:histone H3, putative [Entamoeba invadens IP1]ELP87880.1 histone H3, putative [Entamoeba invadens IP1]|eukprot:XP_004254651.1 histone H3, putative [Entamoeba invadens IP1]